MILRLFNSGSAEPTEFTDEIDGFPEDPIGVMTRLHRRHGSWVDLQTVNRRVIFGFAPEHVQQILTRTDEFLAQSVLYPGPRHSAQRRLAMSLVSANGEEYRQRRRVLQQPLKLAAMDRFQPQIVAMAERLLETWKLGDTLDAHQEMSRLMLQITSGALFGLSAAEETCQAGKMLHEFLRRDNAVGRPGMLRRDPAPEAYQRLLDFAGLLERRILALAERRAGCPADGGGDDVLSALLQSAGGAEGLRSGKRIGDLAFFFGAAHLTTAAAMSWTLLLLDQHPHIAGALREELHQVLHGSAPRPEQLNQMPFLDMVLKESMRLLPPVACFTRRNPAEAEVAGHRAPAGAMIILSQYVTHRRPESFRNPQRFDVRRWERCKPSPYEYFPFSAGQRMCLGASFAMMVIKSVLPVILQRYQLSSPHGSSVNRQVSLVLEPGGGLPMRLERPDTGLTPVELGGNIREMIDFPGPSAARRAA